MEKLMDYVAVHKSGLIGLAIALAVVAYFAH